MGKMLAAKKKMKVLSCLVVILVLTSAVVAVSAEQLSSAVQLPTAKPIITSPLKITPEKDKYYVGDTLTAQFAITNKGTKPITLDKLTVGGRLNGDCPDDKCPDFTFRSTTLQPNVPYLYAGTLTLTQPGEYHFFIAYYIEDPTPEEKKLLDENNWNTCVDLGEGLTHKNRIKNLIALEGEIPSPDTVSELRERINHELHRQVKYPPYLLDPNSFTSAVATVWAKFTSWITQTHLTERYDEFYQTGIDYDCLRFKALKNAGDSLDRGDIVSAKKYHQEAHTYEKLSVMSFGAAAEVFDNNLEAGEILAKGIKEGCEASVKFGLAVTVTNPEAAKAVDYIYVGIYYAVDRALVGKEQAAKNAIVKMAVTTIFNEIKFKDFGDRTIADYTGNKIGKVSFPMLQKAFQNNEQVQFALSKIIKESGVEIGEDAAEYLLSSILDELTVDIINPNYELTADLNCDGKVDSSDYGILMSYWGTDGTGATSCRSPDINQDGIVDSSDLNILKSQWTQPNETPVARITMTSGSETAHEDDVLELTVPSGGTANIHFSASRSTDSDGTISSYQWLINGQPERNKCNFDSNLPEGTYDIFLTVIDNKGAEDYVGATIIITATDNPSHLDQPTQDYSRPAAVTYAKDYARKACSCGNYYGSTHPPEGSGTQLTKNGGDCAHFVSHCLAAGGLSNKGWCEDGYTDAQMCKRGARGWCEGGARDYIITAHEMRDWFTDTSIATKVSTVDQLEPGDVITYGSPPSHAVLYIGDHKVASHSAWGIFSCTHFGTPREYWHINVGSLSQGDSSDGGTPLVSIAKTIRSDSDNIIDLTTSDPTDGSRDVIFCITLTNTGTVDARVTVEDDLANGNYYIADPTGPLPLTDVTVPAGGSYPWEYRARYQGSATADGTPIRNTARITWIHNYYNEVTGDDYGGHGALTSSLTAYIHNPSQPSQDLSADLNCDGKVDSSDTGILMSYWGTDGSGATSCRSPDVNQDGIVDSPDLNILKSQWTQPNETPVARITMTSGSETAYEDDVLELTVPSGGTATVHFSASRSSDLDGTISSYQWLINGQPAGDTCDFDSNLPEGTYDIFLTVIDNKGAEDSVGASIIITSGITAENEPPTAGLSMTSGSETAYEDEVLELTMPSGGTATVHFSASRSTDLDGSISSYQWLINGLSAGNLRDFDSNLGEGTHQIYLTVTDNGGAEDSVGASIIITATAENVPPTAGITMSSGSKTAYEDEVLELTVPSGGTAKVDFSASRSTDSEGSISSYQWLINGQSASNLRDFDSNLGEGTHQIYLTVTDNSGAEGSVGASIIITATAENELPTAGLSMTSGSETAYEDEVLALTVPSGGTAKVDFSASRSSDPDGSISSYQWLINGQSTSNLRDFDSNLGEGTHQIYLTVTDNDGAEDSVGASVIITATAENEPPTARMTMTSGSETAYEDEVLALTVPSGGTATVRFSASRSSDPDGSISSYQWLINGQSTSNLRDFDSNLGEGTHQIYLTVTDNDGAEDSVGASIIITATAENKPPTARMTMTSGSETAYEDEVLALTVPSGGTATVRFSASRSSDPDGSISSYQWLINGQSTSNLRDFDSNLGEGTHQIYLTVTDNDGAEDSVGASIIITAVAENVPPTAGLSMSSGSETAYEDEVLELTVPAGGTANVHFSASRSTDSDGSISSYHWLINGQFASNLRDFDSNLGVGTHQIFLTVTDNEGAEDSIGASIIITAVAENVPPTAGLSMSSGSETAYEDEVLELTVPAGGTANVHFSASRSTDSDGSISSYHWLINGQFASNLRDFNSNLGVGTHQIFLTVTDNEGAEDSVGASIIITAVAENVPPTAGLSMSSGSETAYENEVLALTVPSGGTANVHFSASRSTDSDGSISSYHWLINGQSASNSQNFNSNLGVGTHQIFLTVTDNEGAEDSVGASIIITATAENEPPTAGLSMSSGSETAYENEVLALTVPSGGTANVHFSASRSTDSDGSISSYQWLINGQSASNSQNFNSNLGVGTHQIFLTVTDNDGAEDSVGASIVITATAENEPPTAGITMTSGSKTAYENHVLELTVPSGGTANVHFSASRSTDSDGSISSYKWYIGGSHVSSSRDFSYNLGEGTHQIYLTVTDNKGAEGSVGASVRITATNNPPTAGITMTSGSKTAYENHVLELTVPSGGTANVHFSASRSTDSDGSISNYKWYISGSHVSSSRDFSYDLGEGTHQIFLTVTDNKGAEGSVGSSVRITC